MPAFKTLVEWLNGTEWNTGIMSSGVLLCLLMLPSPWSRQLTWSEQGMLTRLLQLHCTFCTDEPTQASSNQSLLLTVLSFQELIQKMTDKQPQFAYSSWLSTNHSAVHFLDLFRWLQNVRTMADKADALDVCHGPYQLCSVALCSHSRHDSISPLETPLWHNPPFLFWIICGKKTKCLFSATALDHLTSQTPMVTSSTSTIFVVAEAALPEDLSVWCSSWGVWWQHAVLLKINKKILGAWLMLQLCSFLCLSRSWYGSSWWGNSCADVVTKTYKDSWRAFW